MPISIVSTLPAETDEVMERIIGCALNVHRTLGPGFLERIYVTALCSELSTAGLSYQRERPIVVDYKGTRIPGQRIDLVVAECVIVEVKAVERLDPLFQAKLVSYLRTMRLRAGLLINFNEQWLKNGIRRIVL